MASFEERLITTPKNAFEHFVKGFITEGKYIAIRDAEKFKVGARVIAIENHEDAPIKGKCGTIVHKDGTFIGVEFDETFGCGHGIGGLAKPGHGWNMHTNHVRILEESEDVERG